MAKISYPDVGNFISQSRYISGHAMFSGNSINND